MSTEEVSVLIHSTGEASTTPDPLYTVIPDGSYVPSPISVKLTAPDGTSFPFSYYVRQDSEPYSLPTPGYDNFSGSDVPVSVSLGHATQLDEPPIVVQPDGSYSYDYYYYEYQNIDTTLTGGTSPGAGTTPVAVTPDDVSNVNLVGGTDLFVYDGQVFQVTDGVTQGIAQAVTDGNGNQTLGAAVAVDPVTAATVQLDYDLSGQASSPVTTVPLVNDDTGRPRIDAATAWWNDGGGVDFSNGSVGSLMEAEAANHPLQQQIIDQIALFSDPSSLTTYLPDGDPAQGDVQAFSVSVHDSIQNLIGGEIDGSASLADQRGNASTIASLTRDYDTNLLADEQNAYVANVQSALDTVQVDEGRAVELDLVNTGTAALRIENAGTELFGTVDSLATGAVSAVGIAVAAKEIAQGDTLNGVAGLVQNGGTLASAFGYEGAGALGTAFAQGAQIGDAYASGDGFKLASALAKGAVVLSFTAIGTLEGNADAGATVGDNAAKAADTLGNTIAQSDSFNTFLDNHQQLLQAYNQGGFVGLQDAVSNQILSAMPEAAQSAVSGLLNYTPGLNLLVGVNAAEHLLSGH